MVFIIDVREPLECLVECFGASPEHKVALPVLWWVIYTLLVLLWLFTLMPPLGKGVHPFVKAMLDTGLRGKMLRDLGFSAASFAHCADAALTPELMM